ncbi:hypothetical protein [Streptomyces puniciscabiei]|uniref:hypothetical protein n=1 Tax=Streptomyces puniciscabiei TaxID=164348 RepID=UPI0033296916
MHFAALNAKGIFAELNLLLTAYHVLLKLRAAASPAAGSTSAKAPSPRCSG